MCSSRANLVCSDFTRASLEIRSRRLYSSCGDVPILRFNSFTALENAAVAASYPSLDDFSLHSPLFTPALSPFTAPRHSCSFPEAAPGGLPMAGVATRWIAGYIPIAKRFRRKVRGYFCTQV
jgi:hypothetical protein